MSHRSGYEFLDAVTSDLCFLARGETLESLFEAAAEALLAATLENPESVGAREERRLTIEEPDLELLLLGFLNELVYLRDADELLLRPMRLQVHAEGAARLEAQLVGERLDPTRHHLAVEVKAVTAHGLYVKGSAGAWEARITLDV